MSHYSWLLGMTEAQQNVFYALEREHDTPVECPFVEAIRAGRETVPALVHRAMRMRADIAWTRAPETGGADPRFSITGARGSHSVASGGRPSRVNHGRWWSIAGECP